jgi:lantibiotic leader peptide-processing serine protease
MCRGVLAVSGVIIALALALPARAAPSTEAVVYSVLFAAGTPADEARQALTDAGVRVEHYNAAVGLTTVAATPAAMGSVTGAAAVDGVARSRAVGRTAAASAAPDPPDPWRRIEQAGRGWATMGSDDPAATGADEGEEPLQRLLWGHRRIDATTEGSYAIERGDARVLVGVMDTGVDASHPDLAPRYDTARSRNFTTDLPEVDGPCEEEPDASCDDPVGLDEDGHGTHVAGTIAATANGLGIAGIAPEVTLVDLRAGQDSGLFFLQPVVDALVHAADTGVDVVNMSFYIDPWLFNCTDNPADPPEAQAEQRTIIEATQRALDYAHEHGVTLVAALGNGTTDLGNPVVDTTSPDYPPGAARERPVDNSCLNLPTEGAHVIATAAIGPSGRKSYYSDYGAEQNDVAAPGGDLYDPTYRPGDVRNLILSTYPEALARAREEIDLATGEPVVPHVLADCSTGTCAYYQYLQGTSMASPHTAGVAALIVSAHGEEDDDGRMMPPDEVEEALYASATPTACPEATMEELYPVLVGELERTEFADDICEGTLERNGWYGNGIINAEAAAKG